MKTRSAVGEEIAALLDGNEPVSELEVSVMQFAVGVGFGEEVDKTVVRGVVRQSPLFDLKSISGKGTLESYTWGLYSQSQHAFKGRLEWNNQKILQEL